MTVKINGLQDWMDFWDGEAWCETDEDVEQMRLAYEDYTRREAESEALGYL